MEQMAKKKCWQADRNEWKKRQDEHKGSEIPGNDANAERAIRIVQKGHRRGWTRCFESGERLELINHGLPGEENQPPERNGNWSTVNNREDRDQERLRNSWVQGSSGEN